MLLQFLIRRADVQNKTISMLLNRYTSKQCSNAYQCKTVTVISKFKKNCNNAAMQNESCFKYAFTDTAIPCICQAALYLNAAPTLHRIFTCCNAVAVRPALSNFTHPYASKVRRSATDTNSQIRFHKSLHRLTAHGRQQVHDHGSSTQPLSMAHLQAFAHRSTHSAQTSTGT